MREKYLIKKGIDAKIGIFFDSQNGVMQIGGNKRDRREIENVLTLFFSTPIKDLNPILRQSNKIRFMIRVSLYEFRQALSDIEESTGYKLQSLPCKELKSLVKIM